MRNLIYIILAGAMTGMSVPLQAQNQTSLVSQSDYYGTDGGEVDFFSSTEPLQITLHFDLKKFMRGKEEQEYQHAMITVHTSADDSLTQQIRIRARGFMRCKYCSFPPMMLKFASKKSDHTPIRNGGKLKLVTHCKPGEVFEGYVMKEYLAYRLLNLVTPYSFNTRLVQIRYVDSERPGREYTGYGFLLEDDIDMADRNGAVVVENTNLNQKNMEASDMVRTALFNYMIGNTDWSVPLQHNIKVVKPARSSGVNGIPVAYDFDYSGFVNATYAAPFEELPIESVLERHYMGLCLDEEKLNAVLTEFEDLKEPILGTIREFPYISEVDKKWTTSYIEDFYKLYGRHKSLVTELNRTCKRF